MTISLRNVRPPFVDDDALARSGVWCEDHDWSPGERIRVAAPSGTGKTLLIRLLYGLQRGYGGSLKLFGKEIGSCGEKELARVRRDGVAIVFQNLRLFPHLTARENVAVKSCLTAGENGGALEERARRLGVEKVLDRRCGLLSLGERQRIAILRALSQTFQWILLDEPFSHLDRARAGAAAELIEETCSRNEAGLIVTSLGDAPALNVDREIVL